MPALIVTHADLAQALVRAVEQVAGPMLWAPQSRIVMVSAPVLAKVTKLSIVPVAPVSFTA